LRHRTLRFSHKESAASQPVRASTSISQKNRVPIPVNRPQQARKSVRWAALPHPASNSLRPIGFSHRRRDEKSLIYLRKALSI
jgi:hypothetical protein